MSLKKFKDRLDDKTAKIGVIGLGYVGLPLVMEFCRAGFQVTGFDIDPAKTEKLNAGRSYIKHIAAERIQQIVKKKRFLATTDFSRAAELDALIICVPGRPT